jgi:hypothetical protein
MSSPTSIPSTPSENDPQFDLTIQAGAFCHPFRPLRQPMIGSKSRRLWSALVDRSRLRHRHSGIRWPCLLACGAGHAVRTGWIVFCQNFPTAGWRGRWPKPDLIQNNRMAHRVCGCYVARITGYRVKVCALSRPGCSG